MDIVDKQQLIEKLSQKNIERYELIKHYRRLMQEYKRTHFLSYHWDKFLAAITGSTILIRYEIDINDLYHEMNGASRVIGQIQQQINIEKMLAGNDGVT